MDKQVFLWESLVAYINTYEYLIWSTSGVCSLIFVTSVVLLSKKLGVLGNNPSVRLSWPSLLVVTILLCIGTFISNLYIHTSIAKFFSTLYQQKETLDYSLKWSKYGDKVSIYDIVEYFKIIRENKLTCYSILSLAFCGLSVITIFFWFILNIPFRAFCKNKGDVPNGQVKGT